MRDSRELYIPVTKNDKYGFFELKDAYRKTMQDFYRDEYYQEGHALYWKGEYDALDLKYKENLYTQKLYVLKKWGGYTTEQFSLLDIGAGEGYALAFFKKNGWNVTGIDLSSYGIVQHNPEMERYLLQGDFEKMIEQLCSEGRRFDFINADNILEHVPDPEKFFISIKGICHEHTIFCVTVPNDYSKMQRLAYEMGMIDAPFWVTKETSEHFSYFSVDSLSALGDGNGYKKIVALADWPIDFFLLHPRTNYRKDSSVGHDCHVASTRLQNAICEDSMDNAIKLFQALAETGIGRKISVYFKLK